MEQTDLQKRIRTAFLKARVAKDSALTGILSILLTEIENKTLLKDREPLSEAEIVAIIKKLIKNLEESIEIYKEQGKEDLLQEELKQLKLLKSFLPEPLSESELEEIIVNTIKAEGKDMGKVMKSILTKYGARVDAKALAQLVRRKIAEV